MCRPSSLSFLLLLLLLFALREKLSVTACCSSLVTSHTTLLLTLPIIIGGSCHKYRFFLDETSVVTNICRDKFCQDKLTFVETNCLYRDKSMLVATKTFVPTIMILVAAPAKI